MRVCKTEAQKLFEEKLQVSEAAPVAHMVNSYSVLFQDVSGRMARAVHNVDVSEAILIK